MPRRAPGGGRLADVARRARRDRAGGPRRRDRPARRRVQRDGAGARGGPQRARDPEHRARDAGDRARGALAGARRGRRRGPRAARRARGDRGQLALEKARAERYGEFADRLAGVARGAGAGGDRRCRRWSRPRAPTSACSTSRAGATRRAGRAPRSSGSIPAVAGRADRGRGRGRGARGRWRRARWSPSRAATLRVRTGLGGESVVRWEVHVPLRSGERAVGVARWAASARAAFAAEEAPILQRLAAQAAVALAEAGALAQRNWLSQVNAAVLDGVREGIALVGLDHELVFANAAMEALARRLAMPIGAAIGAARASDASDDPEAYFAQWEAMLADTDEPTADELSGVRARARALHGAGRRRGGRADRAPGGAARRHPRARGRPAQVGPDGDRLARAADAAGVGAGLRGAAAHAAAGFRDARGDPRDRPPRGQAAVLADRRLPRRAGDRAGPAGAGARAVLGRRAAGGAGADVRGPERRATSCGWCRARRR